MQSWRSVIVELTPTTTDNMRRMLPLIFFSLLGCALADIYMHYPRGSNNRLNEKTAQRTNANRLFDSQVKRLFKYCSFSCLLQIYRHLTLFLKILPSKVYKNDIFSQTFLDEVFKSKFKGL